MSDLSPILPPNGCNATEKLDGWMLRKTNVAFVQYIAMARSALLSPPAVKVRSSEHLFG